VADPVANLRSRLETLDQIRRQVGLISASRIRELARARGLAAEISEAIEATSPFIEEHTAAVCPACPQVCCRNRHCYHEIGDIIYICSLGQGLPAYREGALDSDPCQFLGERGCRIRRSLRPHRCNWFFCTPLLEHIQGVSPRRYRRFVADIAGITDKRMELINTFASAIDKAGHDFSGMKKASDEIFFRI